LRPGFVTYELARRVGPSGLGDRARRSPRWLEFIRSELTRAILPTCAWCCARAGSAARPSGSLDVVFARWVFSFLSAPDAVARAVARS
jgi:hypothetical protein